jgi:hypothetical protein
MKPDPSTLPRRGYTRPEAASIVGVGVDVFDACVANGTMPQPRIIPGTTKILWDIVELNKAFDALPHRPREGGASPEAPGQYDERAAWLASQGTT